MNKLEDVIYSIERCICHVPDACRDCPYDAGYPYSKCVEMLLRDVLELLKTQKSMSINPEEKEVLQGFSLDIPSSESILNSVNCHAISLKDASHIIAICAHACDVMSSSGFIHWLKERFNHDLVLKQCVPKCKNCLHFDHLHDICKHPCGPKSFEDVGEEDSCEQFQD